jgi:prephenate dehydrogenase
VEPVARVTASAAEAPFARIGIVGVGLIGGSIAMALRRRQPSTHIIVVDHPEVAATAIAQGLADAVAPSASRLTDVDLIVLAAPIPAIVDVLGAIGAARLPAVVTDVGSTKRHILEAARRSRVGAFVGGHPMAGSERGGLEHASAGLLEGRRWFLVPGDATPAQVARVAAFVRAIGAVPSEIDASTHDRTMAYVSHLPQIVSTVLMQEVGESVGMDGLEHAGRGLEDVTRLASSPSEIWQGILATNADFVGEAATKVATGLAALGARLDDPPTVGRTFDAARAVRQHWIARGRRDL